MWYEAHDTIPNGYAIHHKNSMKSDNRLENLECIHASDHKAMHGREGGRLPAIPWNKGAKTIKLSCWRCQRKFVRRESWHRSNIKKGMVRVYCSNPCSTTQININRRRKAVGASGEVAPAKED